MAGYKKAPKALRETAGATINGMDDKSSVHYKGTIISLSPLQHTLFILLSNGKRYSSHQIMKQIHTSDPRKEVQYLRRKGINVQDVWVEATEEFPRHKLYFIDPKESRYE